MPEPLVFWVAELPVFLVPLYLVYLFLAGDEKESLFTFSTVVAGWALSYGLGLFYYHPVPAGGVENAFPSQHSAVIFAALWSAVYLRRWNAAVLFTLATVFTGMGRVLADFHYPVDVLGGATAALIGFGLVYLAEGYVDDAADVISGFNVGADTVRKRKEEWF